MATICLNSVSTALKTPAAIRILHDVCSAGTVDKKAATTEHAPEALNRLRELLRLEHGIRIGKLSNREIATVVEEINFKNDSSITSKEYQDMMETIVKYGSLRARRSPRTRFTLAVVFSAASAVAITAATAAVSPGVLVAAAPVGAAVGAIAVGASSLGSTKRDKKRAAAHTPSVSADTVLEISSAADAGNAATADGTKGQVQPPAGTGAAEESPSADPAAVLMSQVSPTSDELVSAVVEVSSARPTASPAAKQTPFSAASPIPLPLNITGGSAPAAAPAETSSTVPDASFQAASDDAEYQPLPELLLSPSPDPPASEAAAEDSVEELLTPADSLDVTRSADLPPLAKKKNSASKKLKKSFSKGYKSFKKAMSISSSSDLHPAAAAAVAQADKDAPSTPFAGKPPSGFSFRRSFSRDSAKDMSGDGLTVQGSEGSATLRKMKEMLRRSFTLSTPRNSMDFSNSETQAHAF